MKYQILFSGKNKENITNLSTTELAQRVVKVTIENYPQAYFIAEQVYERPLVF